jgi:DeoR C terminal sensor domain/DeoR-like helix-turn-helix domain
MLAAERRDLLVARLRRDGKLVARDLATELGLSEDSVRRDLRELAAAGLCQRVYGGALRVSQALGTLKARTEIAPESKRRIAARAAEMITPGTTAILDSGTTAIEIARALRPDLAATIITHSPTTAAALAPATRTRPRSAGSSSAGRPTPMSWRASRSSGPSRRTPSSACQRSRASSPTRPPATPPCGSCATRGSLLSRSRAAAR